MHDLHKNEDCSGRWMMADQVDEPLWVCTGCGAAHRDTPRTRLAVMREMNLNLILAHLSEAHRPRFGRPGGDGAD